MSFLLRIIIAVVIISLLELYFVKKVHLSVKEYLPDYPIRKLRKITTIVLIVFNLYPAILTSSWMISTIFNTERIELPQNFWFDYFLTYPFWVGIIIIVQSSLFFLVLDFLRGITLLFSGNVRDKVRSIELKLIPFFIIGFIAYVPFRIIYDYHAIDVNNVTFIRADLPEGLKDFRLVFVSDIQADKYTNRYRLGRFINRINQQNPDLVLIAGDLITATPDYIDLSAEYTGKINAAYGVYSCVGDHDNWAYRQDNRRSIQEITDALARQGVQMIDNGREYFDHNDLRIGVTFVTHTYVETVDEEVLITLAEGNEHLDLNIFLTHQPQAFMIDHAYNNNYDLFLAGHTHGGQITFLFPLIHLTPTLIETRFVAGKFLFNGMMLYVTRGLGMSLVPMRYNSTPEVTVITFSTE
jgi:uncharacterized protein